MEKLTAAALAISLLGGFHDLFTKRIPNWITFPAMALGILAQLYFFGWMGVWNATLGIFMGAVLFLPIYFLGQMGAGDVKLLMATGAWMGWKLCFYVAVLSILFGAAYALVEITYRGRFRAVVWNTYSFLRALLVPGLVVEKLRVDESRKFAFGLCVAFAVGTVIHLVRIGRIS